MGSQDEYYRGETMELDRTEPIINTLPHLSIYLKGICDKQQFWLMEHRKWLRGYDITWWRGCMQSQKE